MRSCSSLALLRRGDGDEFDLGELVLADHAAGVFAGGARFGAEARRAGGEPHRQLGFVDDGFADEIGQRNFGGGNEPEMTKLLTQFFNPHQSFRSKATDISVAQLASIAARPAPKTDPRSIVWQYRSIRRSSKHGALRIDHS